MEKEVVEEIRSMANRYGTGEPIGKFQDELDDFLVGLGPSQSKVMVKRDKLNRNKAIALVMNAILEAYEDTEEGALDFATGLIIRFEEEL